MKLENMTQTINSLWTILSRSGLVSMQSLRQLLRKSVWYVNTSSKFDTLNNSTSNNEFVQYINSVCHCCFLTDYYHYDTTRTTRVSQCQKSFSGLYGARGDIRGRHTDNPAGCHSIVLISDLSPSSPNFTLYALPATTLPFYAGLEQAPNMLTCTPPWLTTTSLSFCLAGDFRPGLSKVFLEKLRRL